MYLLWNPSVRNSLFLFLLICFGAGNSFAYTDSEYKSARSPQEVQVDSIRQQELSAIREALGLRAPENRKAELLYRLAELYLEAYRADFLVEGKIHEQKLQSNPSARLERTRSRSHLQNGVSAAKQILDLKVEFSKLDKVYYFLAYNYGELGDSAQSVYYYRLLAERFPQSPFAPEGYRELGEDAFKRGSFAESQRWYELALTKTSDPAIQARLYHRIAWCHYRQRNPEAAIQNMKQAIALTKSVQEKFLSAREEGLRDIAIFYAETGRVEEAIDYFEENAGGTEKLVKSLEKLAKEYENSGQQEKAKQVYAVLLRLNSADDGQFRAKAKLVELDVRQGRIQEGLARLDAIPEIPLNSNDPETLQLALNLKAMVRRIATEHHDQYRKDEKKTKELAVAELGYGIYLNRFLTTSEGAKEKNEIRMYLAEVKRDLRKPNEAASLYRTVAADRDSKYSKEAVSAWVAMLVQELKVQAEANKGKKLSEPSQTEKDFVIAADQLHSMIPNSSDSREVRLRSAQILSGYPSNQKEGMERARRLSREEAGYSQGVLAARLWLQQVSDQSKTSGQLESLRETMTELRDNSTLLATDQKSGGELKKDLAALERNMAVSEIAAMEKNNDQEGAAKAYENFANRSGNKAEQDKSYSASIAAYASSGKPTDAVRVGSVWRSKGGSAALVDKTIQDSATDLFIQGRFKESADLFFEKGKSDSKVSLLLTSAQVYNGANLKDRAIEVYRYALSLTSNVETKVSIYKNIAEIATDLKDDKSQLAAWKDCSLLDSSMRAECHSKIGDMYLKLSDWDQAKAAYLKAIALKKGKGISSPYISYSQFRYAQILEGSMKKEPLQFPTERLLTAFQKRVQELKPVTDAFQVAIEWGGPWGIAATERVGDFAIELANEVQKIMQDKQATTQLRDALMPVTRSLRDKAIQNYKKAYDHAVKDGILSPALPVIHDRLVDSGMKGYFRSQGPKLGIRLIGIGPDGGTEGRDAALKKVREGLTKDPAQGLLWINYGNLLWGQGNIDLARVAYQRALDLGQRQADAMNNLAIVLVSDQGTSGFENWYSANEAVSLWKKSLSLDARNPAALFNLGHFYNYYRLFSLSKKPLETVSKIVKIAEVQDALAVSYAGLGLKGDTEAALRSAEEMGLPANRFVRVYLDSAKVLGKTCVQKLGDFTNARAFERSSIERLMIRCAQ